MTGESPCGVKVTRALVDDHRVLDFLVDFLLSVWGNSDGAIGRYRAKQRQARQRERTFAATQAALAQQRADETRRGGLDYFADRPGSSPGR